MFQTQMYDKALNLSETRQLITEMGRNINEYRDRTGKELDEVLKATVLRGSVDE